MFLRPCFPQLWFPFLDPHLLRPLNLGSDKQSPPCHDVMNDYAPKHKYPKDSQKCDKKAEQDRRARRLLWLRRRRRRRRWWLLRCRGADGSYGGHRRLWWELGIMDEPDEEVVRKHNKNEGGCCDRPSLSSATSASTARDNRRQPLYLCTHC